MRRTLGGQRRRVALATLPLAAVFTIIAASEGLWILAIPGGLYFLVELLVVIRTRRGASRRPAARPNLPPAEPSTPQSPRVVGAPRHTSPRDRVAARRPGRRGRGRPGA